MHVHVDVDRRPAHDGEIEIIAAQRRSDFLPVADRERDIDIRICLRKSGDHERHEVFCGADRADRHASRGVARDHVERSLARLDRSFDPLGKRQHFATGIGQQHAVAGALDQGQSGERLQVAKLQGDRGLGEMELFGGGGHRPVLLHHRQRPQLTDGQFPQEPAWPSAISIRKTWLNPKITKFHLIRQIALLVSWRIGQNGETR